MTQMQIRNLELVTLSLAIAALIACDDDHSPDGDEPDAENPGGACEPQPLSGFCKTATDCPDSLTSALLELCAVSTTHAFSQASSCGGSSILVQAGQSELTYHFDEDEQLIGVYEETDLSLACPDNPNASPSAERAYGRVCTLSGQRAPACQIGCPLIECRAGAVLQARWPFTFARALDLPITACRNDECFTGMLATTSMAPSPGAGVGFTVPDPIERDRDEAALAHVWLKGESGGGVYLELEWTPWSNDDLDDGDRYRVTTEVAGETHVLIDHEVDYALNELGSGACYQSCFFADLDLRELDDTDGGVR